MPASSLKVYGDKDDPTMKMGSDDTGPAPVHASFTMEKAEAHNNAGMAEVRPALAPMSMFQQAHEEQW